MKKLWMPIAIGALLAGGVFAQDRDRDDDRYRYEDRYHQGQRDDAFWKNRLFNRIRVDLDHVQAVSPKISWDQYKLADAKRDLNDLQSKLEAGRYDQPELDRTVNSLSRLVNDSNLAPRDRDMLNDDLNRLKEFRAHHDNYGARG